MNQLQVFQNDEFGKVMRGLLDDALRIADKLLNDGTNKG